MSYERAERLRDYTKPILGNMKHLKQQPITYSVWLSAHL